MGPVIDRRTFLQRGTRTLGGAALLGIVGPTLLEACGSSSKTATSPTTAGSAGASTAAGASTSVAAGALGSLQFMGSWVPDVETGGEYIALR